MRLRCPAWVGALALAVLWGAVPAARAGENVGTTGFAFLKIGTSARASALGEAYTAMTGGLTALTVNPASLAEVRLPTAAATFANLVVGGQLGFAAFGAPVGERGAFALGVKYLSHGELLRTDEEGQTLGTFTPQDVAVHLVGARSVRDDVAVGATLKAIVSSIDDFTSDAYALDLGVTWDVSPAIRAFDGLAFGAAVTNLGFVRSGFTETFEDALPVSLRLGVALRLREAPFTVAADLVAPNDNDVFGSAGVEVVVPGGLLLRGGFDGAIDGLDSDQLPGLSGGAGFGVGAVDVDYAVSSFAELGLMHRVSLSGGF